MIHGRIRIYLHQGPEDNIYIYLTFVGGTFRKPAPRFLHLPDEGRRKKLTRLLNLSSRVKGSWAGRVFISLLDVDVARQGGKTRLKKKIDID